MITRTAGSRRTRAVVLTAGLGLGLTFLSGCSPEQGVVLGTGGPSATTAPTDGSAEEGARQVANPLTAADLPGWTDIAMPESAATSLVYPCGDPTGARDQQSAVRAAALTTPTSVTVLNQVADYDDNDPIKVINETIAGALTACPAYATNTHDVMVRGLAAPTTTPMTGAEIIRTDRETGVRDVTVYWVALAGARTVEVAVSATLGATGENPLGTFALDVLAAAQAKAAGQKVPAVSAPALGAVATQQEADAARATLEAQRQAVVDAGVPADSVDAPDSVENDTSVDLPSGWQDAPAPTPVYQGDGETPPPNVTGNSGTD